MKNEGYINIQGWMINELKLKGNELLLYALIYGFSQDGKTGYRGALRYIQKALQISRPSVVKNLHSLLDKKLITVSEQTGGNIYFANLGVVKKVSLSGKLSLPLSGKETLPNNNLYNNKDTSEASSQDSKVKQEVANHLIEWSEKRRGFKFLKGAYSKQYKAFRIAKDNNMSSQQLKERWTKMESDDFWKEKGFDWMNVVHSFNKKK